MKKKFTLSNALAIAMLGTLATAIGCGGKVEGNTYEDNGGVVKIEFRWVRKHMFQPGQPPTLAATKKAASQSP